MKKSTLLILKISVIIGLCFLPATNAFSYQEEGEKRFDRAANAGYSFFARGGFVHQMESDIDDGGSFSVNRFFIQTGPSYAFGEGNSLSLALGYGFDSYDFSDKSAFGSRQPWDNVNSFRLSVPWRWKINENWTSFISPTLRYTGEQGVDLNDALTGGGFAVFSYRFSDRLSIGPGFGIMNQLEDHTQVIPILAIQWKITDTLSLQTGRGVGATLGPGLTLSWQPSSAWSFSFGGRYDKLRFRLDDDGTASGGIGQDRSFPIFAGMEYRLNSKTRISLIGGTKVGGELSLENSDGETIIEKDHDSAGFLGIAFSARF